MEYWKNDVCLNPNATLGGYFTHRAQAISFSPNPDKPPLYFDYPADDNGNLLEDIWQRWLEHDPSILAKRHPENLRLLAGIYFDHGRSDPTVNVSEAREFDRVLTELGITHVYEEYSGGHSNQWTSRLYVSLPFLSDLLSSEMLVGVEPAGKLDTTWGEIRRR